MTLAVQVCLTANSSPPARPGDRSISVSAWDGLSRSRGNVTNPFCKVKDSYCYRDNSNRQADNFNTGSFFHGTSAVFGGVECQTLRLKVEYEGNNYQDDFAGTLDQKSPVNVGAIYRVADWEDVNVSYERGNTFMFGFTLRTNFNDLKQQHIDEKKPDYAPHPQSEILQYQVVAQQLTDMQSNAGYSSPHIQFKGHTMYMTGQQYKYRDSAEGARHPHYGE